MYINKHAKEEWFTKIEDLIIDKYPSLNREFLQAILIKQLPNADVIQKNKTSGSGKTSHIAITSDSRYFFSSFIANATLNNHGNIFYDNNNYDYIFKLKVEAKHVTDTNIDFIDTNCALWVIPKDENQLGMSKDKFDDKYFNILRQKMFENDIIIFFRYNSTLNHSDDEYYLLFINDKTEKDYLISQIGPLKSKPQYYDKSTDISNIFAELDNTKINSNLNGINKIFFGCPGVGKSHGISKKYSSNIFRTTFHPEYSYYDFIGSIRPICNENDSKQIISYGFIPGDFTKALKFAIDNPNEEVNLIIEELNRANTSSVFGDIFQLLDRDENGISKYFISNSNLARTIYKNCDKSLVSSWLSIDISKDQVKIPNNLNIIATMNTSDQNINVLDTAFTRRWDMEYLPIDFNKLDNELIVDGLGISWADFATKVNNFILSSNMINAEDKQLGPFFANSTTITNKTNFANKVLVYLWKDVFKINRSLLFNTSNIIGINSLISTFKNNPTSVFSTDFLNELNLTIQHQTIKDITQQTKK